MTTYIRTQYAEVSLLLMGKLEISLDGNRAHVWDSQGGFYNFDFASPIKIETSPLKDGLK